MTNTEMLRAILIEAGVPEGDREQILASGGPVYTTAEATDLFHFISFSAPFAFVRRKADGVKGTLEFTHHPRWYFDFQADD